METEKSGSEGTPVFRNVGDEKEPERILRRKNNEVGGKPSEYGVLEAK